MDLRGTGAASILMNETKVTLNLDNREITLIGTAHVSQASIDEVRNVILETKPDCVCVELDEARYSSIVKKDNWEKLDITKVFREGKGFLMMANLVLSGFQRRMGAELGVKPGEEMITAIKTAEEQGIPHSLCDRDVQITLRRAWGRCGMWSKSKLLASLFSSAFSTEKLSAEEIENLKKHNELGSMMAELANYLPSVKETLIDERDNYLAAKIWNASNNVPKIPAAGAVAGSVEAAGVAGAIDAPGTAGVTAGDPAVTGAPADLVKIVAVVGAGHMGGIKTHLDNISRGSGSSKVVDVSNLDTIPSPSFFSKAAGFIIPGIIIALIVAGFFRVGADTSLYMVLRWILWNGSLAALGTLLALGHPLSILVSFVGAPIATINPFVGVGLFSGITQASLRKPRIMDAQMIIDDIGSIKGIYRNRITRALLVFLLSSIGGIIGNFISIPALAGVLFN